MKDLSLSQFTEKIIQEAISNSNKTFIKNNEVLKPYSSTKIRAGIAGGLPFNSLVSDVSMGCLPKSSACYGMCFAAKSSWQKGFDFGKKITNIIDEDLLKKDLLRLPKNQKYLRCGWNSDPSWNWLLSYKIANILRKNDLLTIFITKAFTKVPDILLKYIALTKAEMRVSLSALDTNAQLEHRLKFIERYRELGGIIIPILLTASFKEDELITRQNNIVEWLVQNDFPAAENSLRFPKDSFMLKFIDHSKVKTMSDESSLWSGRLYPKKLVFPTTTSIPPEYTGINSSFLSELDLDYINKLFIDPVRTHKEVLQSKQSLSSPKMCGVSI
ncbi:hypothetical protein [Francisella hispaniensis]|uniref:Uncharacterized protein n=1 Tax=Francisella hispaniensis FSC454 TaxID=1088883 RepID=A0AAC9NP31_9GAMM|nr:hypothetical protein [Francisella hispaniensis]APD49709.1 hypothetical protein FSC454_00400 [Francisella hispaniensis FSC454]KYW87158.1 hypothetical protein AUF42_02210 [Francisella hispaniensis FSC454]